MCHFYDRDSSIDCTTQIIHTSILLYCNMTKGYSAELIYFIHYLITFSQSCGRNSVSYVRSFLRILYAFLWIQSTRTTSYLPSNFIPGIVLSKNRFFIQIIIEGVRDIGFECHIKIIRYCKHFQWQSKNHSRNFILAKKQTAVSYPCDFDSLISFQCDTSH